MKMAVVGHTGRAAAAVAEDVVAQHRGSDVGPLDYSLLERVEKPHGLHQVGGDSLQKESPFDEGLA